jgi:hypothetical protein
VFRMASRDIAKEQSSLPAAGRRRRMTLQFAGVEKKFEVAFGAGKAGGKDVKDLQTGCSGAGLHGGDGFFVEVRVSDDAAGGNVWAGKFELRLDEDKEIGVGRGAGDGSGKDFADGDEGNVRGDERSGLGDLRGREVAGVVLDLDDAGILLELPGELMGGDVDGEDFGGAILQKAVGEAASRGAEVEADFVGWRERKVRESGFKFKAGARGEFLAGGELEERVVGHRCAGFVDASAVETDLAGEDEGLGFFL